MQNNFYKKSLVISLVLIAILVPKHIVFADALPSRMFLINDNNVNCVSIINPEEVGPDSFLVFDYSTKVGIERNQPWTMAEKGKCYEIHDETAATENFYRVKIINGNEREAFADYAKYLPSDSIPDIFCNRGITENYCNDISIDFSIAGPVTAIYTGGSFGYAQTPHTFSDGEATALFPTKYQFYFSSGSYPKELENIGNDPDFILVEKHYRLLTNALNETLQSCDIHARVEHQFSISHAFFEGKDHLIQNLENVIWHFKDGRRILVRYSPPVKDIYKVSPGSIQTNLLYDIYLMGCKSAYINFIKDNEDYLNEIDRLAVNLIKKYPEKYTYQNGGLIQKKEIGELSKLTHFISNPDDNGYALEKEQFNLLTKYQSEHVIIETTVDKLHTYKKQPIDSKPNANQHRFLYIATILFAVTLFVTGSILKLKRRQNKI